jgi:hypothetical protein
MIANVVANFSPFLKKFLKNVAKSLPPLPPKGICDRLFLFNMEVIICKNILP